MLVDGPAWITCSELECPRREAIEDGWMAEIPDRCTWARVDGSFCPGYPVAIMPPLVAHVFGGYEDFDYSPTINPN